MKEIKVEEAGKWSDEEYRFNMKYLHDRGRFPEMREAKNNRGDRPKATKKSTKKEEEELADA